MTWKTLRMKSVPRTPCSQDGFQTEIAAGGDLQPWRRIRRAVDGYATAIVRIIGESYGKDSVQNAWREFTIGSGDQFLGDDPNTELFFSWLFHRWSPESGGAVPPTRAYLARNARALDPLQRRYLEACMAARFSFYEILECKPHIGFKARDVLAGSEIEVSEGMASVSLRNGDIVFAHIVSSDDTAMTEAVSPVSFPPILKAELTALRRHRKWEQRADLALRRLYFRLLETHGWPPLPEVRTREVSCSNPGFCILISNPPRSRLIRSHRWP